MTQGQAYAAQFIPDGQHMTLGDLEMMVKQLYAVDGVHPNMPIEVQGRSHPRGAMLTILEVVTE